MNRAITIISQHQSPPQPHSSPYTIIANSHRLALLLVSGVSLSRLVSISSRRCVSSSHLVLNCSPIHPLPVILPFPLPSSLPSSSSSLSTPKRIMNANRIRQIEQHEPGKTARIPSPPIHNNANRPERQSERPHARRHRERHTTIRLNENEERDTTDETPQTNQPPRDE